MEYKTPRHTYSGIRRLASLNNTRASDYVKDQTPSPMVMVFDYRSHGNAGMLNVILVSHECDMYFFHVTVLPLEPRIFL